MDNYLLSLFQLCDSNLPTGAFSHSFGLETYIQENKVHDKDSFSEWLRMYVTGQLVYTDGLACRLAFEALERNDAEEIWALDRKITVQALPRETREGTYKIGERMLTIGNDLYPAPLLSLYKEKTANGEAFGHPAIVFTMIAHQLNVPENVILSTYLYSTISGLTQNAVRGIPLGQTAGQFILRDIQQSITKAVEQIRTMDIADFGAVAPGLEISQMKHERVHIRIFMS
ncbi:MULTISPECIES: urease accessory protein UreF [Bacillaceae]|uniref:Urease accessory protein UreF n=1 Tax=Domibacillus aminovorans TaxID=29332 RepID=A0A177KZ54_9BACI|nr:MULTISPECIES: urease accessory protein UreF [Bacillaceae]OAH58416.1 urease accessory protein UreF [Domibacillus aminovorans]